MAEILHRVEIKTPPAKLYAALTEQDGLAQWWTPMVEATPKVGAIAKFRFGPGGVHGPDMRVTELVANARVAWECVDGPWQGHAFHFDIRPAEKGSVLLFAQRGWAEADEFYMHCNAKWGFFLVSSLKPYLETGVGVPHPGDPDF